MILCHLHASCQSIWLTCARGCLSSCTVDQASIHKRLTHSWLFLAPWDFAFFCVTSRYRPPTIPPLRLPLGNYFSYLSLSKIWASSLLILVYLFLNEPLVMLFLLPAPRQIVCLCCRVSGTEPMLSLTQPSAAVVCLPARVGVNLWTVSLYQVFCWDWVHAITHYNNSEVSPQSKMHLL